MESLTLPSLEMIEFGNDRIWKWSRLEMTLFRNDQVRNHPNWKWMTLLGHRNSDSIRYSPIDFEILGGKAKSRNWRRSIMHENLQLGIYLSSIGVHPDKPSSSPLTTGSSIFSRGHSRLPS